MTDAVTPVASSDDRRAGRRSTDPLLTESAGAEPARSNLPVVVPQPPKPETPAAPFEAQLLGQDGQRRGLKGGQPVLDKAKSAYLGAEYSGKADRRPPKGLFSRTEI